MPCAFKINSMVSRTAPLPPGTDVNSPLINIKSAVGTASCTANGNSGSFVPTFDADGALTNPPAFPGPNPAPNP